MNGLFTDAKMIYVIHCMKLGETVIVFIRSWCVTVIKSEGNTSAKCLICAVLSFYTASVSVYQKMETNDIIQETVIGANWFLYQKKLRFSLFPIMKILSKMKKQKKAKSKEMIQLKFVFLIFDTHCTTCIISLTFTILEISLTYGYYLFRN